MLYHVWNVCSAIGMIMLIVIIPLAWIWPSRIREFMQKHDRFSTTAEMLSVVGFLRAVLSVYHIL